jgi:hypothetical protein
MHAAAIRNAAGDDSGTAWSAAWLTVKGKERHSFSGEPVEVRGSYAAAITAAIDSEIAPSDVITNDQDDVWLAATNIL